MKVTVKKLQGGECDIDILPSTTIKEIKQEITRKLNIPSEEQKLLLLGRTLADDQTVQSYSNIKDGTKLNLIVKKPAGLLDMSIRHFKKSGMKDNEAISAANRFITTLEEKFKSLSWDDIERLVQDCMLAEGKGFENKPMDLLSP